jgi:hypothetical protein
MRNLDTNTYLTKPELDIVETKKGDVTGASFVLWADLASQAEEDEAANKPKRRVAAGG